MYETFYVIYQDLSYSNDEMASKWTAVSSFQLQYYTLSL